MKEFYKTKHGVLYQGDCVNMMEGFKVFGKTVDLAVTSPPYDNLRKYKGYSFDFEKTARGLSGILNPGGVIVWVVGDATVKGSETGTSFKQALYFKEGCGLNLHDTMIYRKANPGGARGSIYAYWQAFEYMFVFSKGKPQALNLIHDRVNKDGGRTGKQGGRRAKSGETESGRVITTQKLGRRFNIWSYSTTVTDKTIKGHPAPFPEQLAADHILSWSNPGDTVFDPMAGSGTTLKMAEQLGRKWVGCEISEEYCEIIAKRLDSLKN